MVTAMDGVGSWRVRRYDAEHALEKARERLSEEMDNNRRLHKELAAAEERVQTYENGIRWANLRGELAKANRERDEAREEAEMWKGKWNGLQTRPPDDTGVHYSGGGLWSGCTKSRTVDAPAVEPQPEDERTPGRVRRLIPRQNRNMNLSDRRTSDPLESKGRAARKDHQQ